MQTRTPGFAVGGSGWLRFSAACWEAESAAAQVSEWILTLKLGSLQSLNQLSDISWQQVSFGPTFPLMCIFKLDQIVIKHGLTAYCTPPAEAILQERYSVHKSIGSSSGLPCSTECQSVGQFWGVTGRKHVPVSVVSPEGRKYFPVSMLPLEGKMS